MPAGHHPGKAAERAVNGTVSQRMTNGIYDQGGGELNGSFQTRISEALDQQGLQPRSADPGRNPDLRIRV